MSARIATLLTAGAMIAAAQPALANDHVPELEAETVWIADDAQVSTAHQADLPRAPHGYRWVRADEASTATSPRLGYSEADREAWLTDCTIMLSERQVDWDAYGRDDVGGGLIGGLLGAIVGGIAGNRIADGDRLAGTLLGGGIGGVAGAVIGSVIDGDDDEYEGIEIDPYAAEYCGAYLRRYEAQGIGAIGGHSQLASGQTVMLVSQGTALHSATQPTEGTLRRRICRSCQEEVVETGEVIVEEPVAARAIPPRREPVKTKRIPIN